MSLVLEAPSCRRSIARLAPVIGLDRYERLRLAADEFRVRFAGRTIWNVNSTAAGGGVAEMLHALVGYVQDLGIMIRWLVIHGDADFFSITKRLHNGIHGHGQRATFGTAEAHHYSRVLAANAVELLDHVLPGDVVLLHDPQTAGLAAPLVDAGALVVWRCHIGVDDGNDVTEAAWAFLRPHVTAAHGWVFSRRTYAPAWLPGEKVWIVADALPGADDDLIIQVSRWDRLKDMEGVLHGFAHHVAPQRPAFLALVGPAVTNVADDPEGAAVYADCLLQWRALPPAVRARTLLVTLPLDDIDENAAMVNALQRHARIVAQKSLAEGFGLTVAEAMWKGSPVVGSAIGGITDQIAPGTGILLRDPTDLAAFGAAIRRLLDDQPERSRMGAAAHAYVRANFVGDLHLLRYADVFSALMSRDGAR